MARVPTNNVGLRFVRETSTGVLATSGWRVLEPNDITAFGAELTTVDRRPISPDRGRKKGTVTDLDSSVEFEADLTVDAFDDFAEGFVFAEWANVEFSLVHPKLNGAALDTDGTTDDFDLTGALSGLTNGTLLVSKLIYNVGAARSLLYAKGYLNAANNGLHELNAQPVGGDAVLQVASSLVTETAPANATVDVAGVRVSDGDLTLTVSGSTATLVSAADVTDWAALGILAGMYIYIGSDDGSGGVQNALGTAAGTADDTYGYARVTSVSGATINLDKLSATITGTADNTGDGDADIMFGRFLRNVAVTNDSDDNRYFEQTFGFETVYPDLGGVGTDEYEYALGNFANELSLNIPLGDKATATWGFIGTTTDPITASRETGPSSALSPLRTTAFNTSSDVASISTDVVSSVSDVCFKDLTLTLNNNVSAEKCIGVIGATAVNVGLFEVTLEGQMLFTRKEITNAIRNNTTVTFAAILKNDDGAIAIDIPSLTFGDGSKEYPTDEAVLVNITGTAFNDPAGTIPNVSLGITRLASVPTNA